MVLVLTSFGSQIGKWVADQSGRGFVRTLTWSRHGWLQAIVFIVSPPTTIRGCGSHPQR
jgi:hypothetical protein